MRATVFYNPPALAKANFVPVAAVRKEKVFLSPILPDSENFPPTCPQYHFILDSLLWDGVASPSRPTVHVHATFACTCTPLAGGRSEFQLNGGAHYRYYRRLHPGAPSRRSISHPGVGCRPRPL